MKIFSQRNFSILLFLMVLMFRSPVNCDFVENALDIIHIVWEISSGILKTWDIVKELPLGKNVELPILRYKQKKVLDRLGQISIAIADTEKKYSQHIEAAVNTVNDFSTKSTSFMIEMNDMRNILNRIASRFQEMQDYKNYQDELENTTLLQFAKWTVYPNDDAINSLMRRLHLTVIGYDDNNDATDNIFSQLLQFYKASKDYMCQTQQSPQQFVHSLYSDIALTELKGYTMMEFSWMILRLYNKGNYTKEAELMRENYDRRNKRTLKELHTVMQRADRSIWRCDPDKYVLGETYDEVTRLLQGYIENEVDMNNEETCRETCEYYTVTHSQGCFKGGTKFCSRQPRCSGKLYNCQYIDSDMLVCPEDNNSTRRYRYIQYENGEFYGEEKTCQKNIIPVDSWWRYLFWHCSYCMCLCDEQGPKSDRYFSLRPTVSDTDRNMIVTGVRMVKKKRVFHIQIQQAELLPRGIVNVSTISWKPLETFNIFDDNVRSGRDYHTLKYENRSIDLDDVEMVDSDFVVTGVVFKMIGTHLNLAVRFSEAHFETGKLVSPHVNSIWMSNDTTPISGNRSKIKLSEPTVPTRTIIKSSMRSHSNQYIDFTNTNLQGDVAQTTVPFIDSQDVVSKSPVPLSGVGIYYKGQNGYGGFIAPKIITYDLTPFTRVVKSVKFNKL